MSEDDKNWILDAIAASVNALEIQLTDYIDQEIISVKEDLENQIANIERNME